MATSPVDGYHVPFRPQIALERDKAESRWYQRQNTLLDNRGRERSEAATICSWFIVKQKISKIKKAWKLGAKHWYIIRDNMMPYTLSCTTTLLHLILSWKNSRILLWPPSHTMHTHIWYVLAYYVVDWKRTGFKLDTSQTELPQPQNKATYST